MWDVFISHASEDKELVARPLASLLRDRGLSVWYDEFSLKVGDSLSETIDRGLAASKFGVLILSPAFFAKPWPRRELRGLTTREILMDQRILLPIWHEVSAEEVAAFSLPLADLYGVRTTLGLEDVADRIADVVSPERATMHGRLTAAWQEPGVHPGYLDPVRANDFELLRAAFEKPLQPSEERALLLVPTLVLPVWGGPDPVEVRSAFYCSIAETVRGFAATEDIPFQVAKDEVGMLIPRGSNREMIARVANLGGAVDELLGDASASGSASCFACTLQARWTIDVPFWEALRKLRGWVAETRARTDNDGGPAGLSGNASRLNI
jgi:TIR domain